MGVTRPLSVALSRLYVRNAAGITGVSPAFEFTRVGNFSFVDTCIVSERLDKLSYCCAMNNCVTLTAGYLS